jgi:hypothetical protein
VYLAARLDQHPAEWASARQAAPILAGSSLVIGSVSRLRGTVLRLSRLTRTFDRHSVRLADLDLGLDPTNSPGDEGHDDVSQPRQGPRHA